MASNALVYLDVDDEITSAASRIRGANAPGVVLVIPHGSRLATSRINFRLLAREAAGRDRRLLVVAPDPATRALAAAAGLPVYPSVAAYEAGNGAATSSVAAPSSPSVAVVPTARPAGRPAAAPPAAQEASAHRGGPPDERERVRPPGVAVGDAVAERTARSVVHPPDRRLGALAAVTALRAAVAALSGAVRIPALPAQRRRTIGVVSVASVLLLLGGVTAYLLLPSADVAITLRPETVGPLRLAIRADPDAAAPDTVAGIVPARRLTIDVAASGTFPATGKRVEASPATGSVVFSNLDTGSPNSIPAGAIVSTEGGIQFRTGAAVTLPRAQLLLGAPIRVEPSTRSVAITAVEAGTGGNVPANAITVVPPGEDPTLTKVNNPAPVTGGTRQEFPRVVQADVDAAVERLRGELGQQFEAILGDQSRVPAGLTLFPETAALRDPVPTVQPAGLVDQEVAEFQLGLAATGTVIAVDEQPVDSIARARVAGAVAMGYRLVDGSIRVDRGTPVVSGEIVTFPVSGRASQIRVLDPDELRAQILGKPLPEALALLEPFGEAALSVWPDWVTAIPTIDSRVTLTVEPPVGAAASPASPSPAPPPTGEPDPSPSASPSAAAGAIP